jgi:uncharacterized protein
MSLKPGPRPSPLPAPPAAGPTPVGSPCTGVCRMRADGAWCEGCSRTLDEIAAWSHMDDAQRRAVWHRLPQRRAQAPAAAAARRV